MQSQLKYFTIQLENSKKNCPSVIVFFLQERTTEYNIFFSWWLFSINTDISVFLAFQTTWHTTLKIPLSFHNRIFLLLKRMFANNRVLPGLIYNLGCDPRPAEADQIFSFLNGFWFGSYVSQCLSSALHNKINHTAVSQWYCEVKPINVQWSTQI